MRLEALSSLAPAADILPENAYGWVYYAICALFFLLCGLFCGYFVWRKGHMQTLDAEFEVKRTEDELMALRHDLSLEEKELRPADDGEAIDELLSHFGTGEENEEAVKAKSSES